MRLLTNKSKINVLSLSLSLSLSLYYECNSLISYACPFSGSRSSENALLAYNVSTGWKDQLKN